MAEFETPTIQHKSLEPARIKSVTIEGFRSLKNIQRLELPQLTVLIGANGAGKSILIRFFEMLSWMLKAKNLQEFVLRHGGGDDQFFMGGRATPVIQAEVEIEVVDWLLTYGFELGHLSAGDAVLIRREYFKESHPSFPVSFKKSHLGGAFLVKRCCLSLKIKIQREFAICCKSVLFTSSMIRRTRHLSGYAGM